MALQIYIPSEAEKKELARLQSVYNSAVQAKVFWDNNLKLASEFLSSTTMSNYNAGSRAAAMDDFQMANTWFTWRNWLGGIQYDGANPANINRGKYENYVLNIRNMYVDEMSAADIQLKAYKAILDQKNLDLIAAQSDTIVSENAVEAAQLQKDTVKYWTDKIPLIIFGLIVVIIISFFAYRKLKK